MPAKRILGFASEAECAEVVAWATDPATLSQMLHLKNEGDRADGVFNRMTQGLTGTKHTLRLMQFDSVPPIVDAIRQSIIDLAPPNAFLGPNPETKREWLSRVIVHEADTDTTNHDDLVRERVPELVHWRCNLVCEAPIAGGLFKLGNREVPVEVGELMVFNANEPHTLEAITEGRRVILTFGWLI